MPRRGIDMKADAARIKAIAASTEPGLCAPDDERDRVIDMIARLLSSGQQLPDILQNIRREVEGTATDTERPNGAAEPDGQTLPAELRETRSGSETIRHPQPEDAILAEEEAQESSGAFDPHARAAAAVDPGALDAQQSSQAAPGRQTWRIKLSGLLQAALLSIIPAVSLAVVAVAGKSLIGSDAVPNAF